MQQMERVLKMTTKKRALEIIRELKKHREERIRKYQEWCKNTQPKTGKVPKNLKLP